MNWRRFLGLEKRQAAPYSDAIVQAIQDRATGISPDPGGVGALEIAAGLWARGLASATISPASPVTSALSPAVLASMGRGLVRRGESLFVLDVRDGALRMLEASSWDVSGGHDPASWVYRVDLPGPSVTASRRYPAASVVHVRFAVHPSSPWRGVSPLAWATSTGKLGAFLENRLGEESSGPVGYLLSVPSEGGDENLEGLRSDLANLGGGVSIVETTAGGWGEGRGAAPRSRLETGTARGVDPCRECRAMVRRGPGNCWRSVASPLVSPMLQRMERRSGNHGGVFCMEVSSRSPESLRGSYRPS